MKIGDIKIRKQAIIDAMESGNWCNDWSRPVEYYLRHRLFISIRYAYEQFQDEEYYYESESESECESCGQAITEEISASSPSVDINELERLFGDMGEDGFFAIIQAFEDQGVNWLEVDVPDIWVVAMSWTYQEEVPVVATAGESTSL